VDESSSSEVSVGFAQPARRLGVVGEQEEDEDCAGAGWDALDDEQPLPTAQAMGTVDVAYSIGNCASKLTWVSVAFLEHNEMLS
jgi:hypothetical protein